MSVGNGRLRFLRERLARTFVISSPTAGITLNKSLVGKHSQYRPLLPDAPSCDSNSADILPGRMGVAGIVPLSTVWKIVPLRYTRNQKHLITFVRKKVFRFCVDIQS